MTVIDRLRKVVEEEAPAWGVRPTTSAVRRLRGLDFAILWGDLGIGLLVLVTGGLLVPALGLPEALLAIVVGSLLGCVPLALVGVAGAREGLPGMVLLRHTLGVQGSYLPTVLNVGQLIGWTAFELWAMALVASWITGPILGLESFYLWLTVAAALCLLLSLGGPVLVVRRWMERFGAWVLAAVALWVTVRLLTSGGLGTLWARQGRGGFPTFWSAVDLVIAMPISWVPLVADYTRFARRGAAGAGAGTYLGYLLANVWFYALGALLVLGPGGSGSSVLGIAAAIAGLTGGSVVLIILLVGETDEAFADIYSAAVSMQNVAPRLHQRAGVILVAAAGVAIGAWLFGLPGEGILTFEFFLLLIGSVFVPLFAVFTADHFVLRRRPVADPAGEEAGFPALNVAALVAWVLGFATFHWIAPTQLAGWSDAVETLFSSWLGLPFPLFGGQVPASVVAFSVAFLVYLPLGAVTRRDRGGRAAVR